MGRYGERVAEVCQTAYGRDVLPAGSLTGLVSMTKFGERSERRLCCLLVSGADRSTLREITKTPAT